MMNVLNQKEMLTKNLRLEKGDFLWFKLFVKALISMKDGSQAHHDLIEILPKNDSESQFIAEFAQNYTADKAIEWLIRDDLCLLQEINKALRQQHLDRLFTFRYLINDIHQQLRKEHDKERTNNHNIMTLYRSQVLSPFEFKHLQENTGELIAINTFMLTWNDRSKVADFFKKQRHSDFISTLFEIEVDYKKKSNPFAQTNVTDGITLFMLGCIFRIRSITKDIHLKCHILKLELCGDDDDGFKSVYDYMTENLIQPETDLITLGSVLYRMGEYDKAKKYFNLILNELDRNDPNYAFCYDGLGNIEYDQGRLEEALKHHKQALNLRKSSLTVDESCIALSHINIATDYKEIGDSRLAKYHVECAKTFIQNLNSRESQAKVAACHIIMGCILHTNKNNSKALYEFQQALEIYKQQGMPDNYPDLGLIYQHMGLCYLNTDSICNDPKLALNYFTKALEIRRKALPVNHHSTGITYRSVGLAYEGLNDCQTALEYYQKANSIYQVLKDKSNELRMIQQDIKRIQK